MRHRKRSAHRCQEQKGCKSNKHGVKTIWRVQQKNNKADGNIYYRQIGADGKTSQKGKDGQPTDQRKGRKAKLVGTKSTNVAQGPNDRKSETPPTDEASELKGMH